MSKTITFLMPTKVGPIETAGKIAWLQLGSKKHKFIINNGALTDYATGYKFADLGDIKVERMARISHHTRTNDRQAAEIVIARAVARVGLPKILEVMGSKPVLNK